MPQRTCCRNVLQLTSELIYVTIHNSTNTKFILDPFLIWHQIMFSMIRWPLTVKTCASFCFVLFLFRLVFVSLKLSMQLVISD